MDADQSGSVGVGDAIAILRSVVGLEPITNTVSFPDQLMGVESDAKGFAGYFAEHQSVERKETSAPPALFRSCMPSSWLYTDIS